MKRRHWLQLGAASAVLLAVGGASLALLQPGLAAGRLTDAGRRVMRPVARALLDGALPLGAERDGVLNDTLTRLDATLAGMPPAVHTELSQLLSLMASAPGRWGLVGLRSDWDSADEADVRAALQAMRTSTVSLRQQGYQGLHDLVMAAHYADASAWRGIGYPGPREVMA